jgi:hypothetical protein
MTAREFPNWEALYQEKPVETMPWFNPNLELTRGLRRLEAMSAQ